MNRVLYFSLGVLLFCSLTGATFLLPETSIPHQQRARLRSSFAADPADDEPTQRGQGPIAEVPAVSFDFGTMHSLASGTHEFLVRNAGDATLVLADGGTSCKCAVSQISDSELAPGEEATIRVRFNTGSKSTFYGQSVTIATNDPEHEEIRFRITGKISNQVVVSPDSLELGRVSPTAEGQAETLIYSEQWQDFAVEDVRCVPAEGTRYRLEPVELPAGNDLNIGRAYRLTLHTDGRTETGPFRGLVRFRIVPPKGADPQECELEFHGEMLGRLGIFGRGIDARGNVEFGAVAHGQGKTLSFLVKLRDDVRELNLVKTELGELDFLNVSLEAKDTKLGLYQLYLEVPKDAPLCSFLGVDSPKIKLHFDHPRKKSLELSLRLAVINGPFPIASSSGQ